MRRFLPKFVVAFLMLLSDSAFAAEYHHDNISRNPAGSYSSQLALPEQTNHYCLESQTSSKLQHQISVTLTQNNLSLLGTLFTIIPNQLHYSLFSPRAPPAISNTI